MGNFRCFTAFVTKQKKTNELLLLNGIILLFCVRYKGIKDSYNEDCIYWTMDSETFLNWTISKTKNINALMRRVQCQ